MTNRQVAMTCLLCTDALMNVITMCSGMPSNKEDAVRVTKTEQVIREFYELLSSCEGDTVLGKLAQLSEVVG